MAWNIARLKRRVLQSRAAFRPTLLFHSTFAPYHSPDGKLERCIRNDEFVIAYPFGVMTRVFDQYGTVGNSGVVLLKRYDGVFPGHGQEICALAVARVKSKNEQFLGDTRSGAKEAKEYLAMRGKCGLPSLKARLEEIAKRAAAQRTA